MIRGLVFDVKAFRAADPELRKIEDYWRLAVVIRSYTGPNDTIVADVKWVDTGEVSTGHVVSMIMDIQD